MAELGKFAPKWMLCSSLPLASHTKHHTPVARGQTQPPRRLSGRVMIPGLPGSPNGSSSSRTANDSMWESAVSSTATRSSWSRPSDWRGTPPGTMCVARASFPSVGAACAARGACHEESMACFACRNAMRRLGDRSAGMPWGSALSMMPPLEAELRLELLLAEFEAMASELPGASLVAAGRRIATLVASRSGSVAIHSGSCDDGLLLPMRLDDAMAAAEGAGRPLLDSLAEAVDEAATDGIRATLVHAQPRSVRAQPPRKRSIPARWNADYLKRVKRSSFAVLLAELKASLAAPVFKSPYADARMRYAAKAAGERQKLGPAYSARDRVAAVIAAMEKGNATIAPCDVLNVYGTE
jgi:hypothetical protein